MASPAEQASVLPPGAGSSYTALAARLPGRVGLAVAPLGDGPIHTLGALAQGHAWSTMKVPVLVTLLSDYAQQGEALSPQQQDEATRALEQSDNGAAEALFGDLEQMYWGLVPASGAVQETLSSAGDTTTTINTQPNSQGFTTWGQSIWSNANEVVFYRALADGCLLDPSDTSYVLGLMRNVTASQRWGAGSAGYPPDLSVAFKGGWGPENGSGYLVRQTVIVGAQNRGYVLSMSALPGDGSFATGTTMLTELATWARENLVAAAAPSTSCPSSP